MASKEQYDQWMREKTEQAARDPLGTPMTSPPNYGGSYGYPNTRPGYDPYAPIGSQTEAAWAKVVNDQQSFSSGNNNRVPTNVSEVMYGNKTGIGPNPYVEQTKQTGAPVTAPAPLPTPIHPTTAPVTPSGQMNLPAGSQVVATLTATKEESLLKKWALPFGLGFLLRSIMK